MDKNIFERFRQEQAQKVLLMGRYFSAAALIVLFYFTYQDLEIYHYKELLPFRSIGFLGIFVFLIFSFLYKNTSYRVVGAFHFFSLFSIMVMMAGIVFTAFIKNFPFEDRMGAIHGLIFVTLTTAIFSMGISKYLFLINLPVFVLPFMLWLYHIPSKKIGSISNCVALSFACIFMGFLYYKTQKREFLIKLALESKNKELSKNIYILSVIINRLKEEISARKKLERELKEISMKDELTKIYNRRAAMFALESKIKEAYRSDKKFSICFIDLDNFKYINDIFGHKKGDEVLKDFADVLRKTVRGKRDMVFRFGGDEFLIFLDETDTTEALEIINRIKEHINRSSLLEGLRVMFSAGVAEYKKGMTLDELMKKADTKMYSEKKSKKQKLSLGCRDKIDV